MAGRPAQQLLPQAALVRVFGVHPLEGQWTGQMLTADLPDFSDHTENHRRQRSAGSRVVILARAMAQGRTPEGGHIHRDGPVAFVAMNLPAGQPFDLLLPQAQDDRRLPDAAPEGRPGSTGGLSRQTDGLQCGEDRSPLGQQRAADQHLQKVQ